MNADSISLQGVTPLGTGTSRACYPHPNDPFLCIKIPLDDRTSQKRQSRELRYYKRLKRSKVSMRHISQYHGSIITDKGEGYVYDRIIDFDGVPSRDLNHHLQNEEGLQKILIHKINELGKTLESGEILFHDLNASNVFCQKIAENNYQLIIIDGLGDASFFKFIHYFKMIRKRTIRRRWKRVVNRFSRYYPWIKPGMIK